MKRIISLFMVLVLVFCLSGCSKNETKTESAKVSANSEYNAEKILEELKKAEGVSSSDPNGFDNTVDTNTSTPTPGLQAMYNVKGEYALSQQTESVETVVATVADTTSALAEGENQFYYEGESYVYGITAAGDEIIGFLDDNGDITDVLGGGGYYTMSGSTFKYGAVNGISQSVINGEDAITVTYALSGANSATTVVSNTYVFHPYSITVTADVDTVGTYTVSVPRFRREYIRSSVETEKKICYEWIYPQNGDYPYPKSDGVCIKQRIDDDHILYCYNRDPNQGDYFYLNSFPENYIDLSGSNEKEFSYSITIDMVFENNKKSADPDYTAFFKGRNSDFAVGLAPVTGTNDDSTVFVGKEAALNLNVTNLTDKNLNFSLRYDVRDYYGNIVDIGLFVNSTLFKNDAANRTITVKDTYGMYWVNLYVVSQTGSTYYECYPFALFEDYEFLYRNESSFGVCAPHAYTEQEYLTNVSIMDKIGLYRVRESNISRLKLLKERGMTAYYNGGGDFSNPDELNSFVKTWEDAKEYGGFCWMVTGNEADGSYKEGKEAMDAAFPVWLAQKYTPMVATAKEKNIPMAYIATCHGNSYWHKLMYEHGVWQDSQILDSHYYCHPKAPDKYQVSGSCEANMETMLDCFEKYGGLGEKVYNIGEIGSSTPSNYDQLEGTTGLDIRTQADFNTRMGLLGTSHGADNVNFYCLLDRTGYYKGTGEWLEMNFGAFYCYDYYNIVKPKPWAVAFSTMARQFDGMTSVKESEKYDTDGAGTLRAFDVENHQGDDLIVAWSNIYMLPNTTSQGMGNEYKRIPNLPWNNLFTRAENVTFDATKDVVTVIDTMGNVIATYTAENGKVTIPVTGSPIYIYGVE